MKGEKPKSDTVEEIKYWKELKAAVPEIATEPTDTGYTLPAKYTWTQINSMIEKEVRRAVGYLREYSKNRSEMRYPTSLDGLELPQLNNNLYEPIEYIEATDRALKNQEH